MTSGAVIAPNVSLTRLSRDQKGRYQRLLDGVRSDQVRLSVATTLLGKALSGSIGGVEVFAVRSNVRDSAPSLAFVVGERLVLPSRGGFGFLQAAAAVKAMSADDMVALYHAVYLDYGVLVAGECPQRLVGQGDLEGLEIESMSSLGDGAFWWHRWGGVVFTFEVDQVEKRVFYERKRTGCGKDWVPPKLAI